MGLNFNRGAPIKYYSSDRICSLIANGLLTFLQKGYGYEDFLKNKKHVLYFDDENDLLDQIKYYSKNFEKRSYFLKQEKNVTLNCLKIVK